MKLLKYAIEDIQIGKNSLVNELGFTETDYFYFTNGKSFYRRYNLELGLDICILELNLNTAIKLNQLASTQPLYFTNIYESTKESSTTKSIMRSEGKFAIDRNIEPNEVVRALWFSFSQRWLENKSISEQINIAFFTTEYEKPNISFGEEFNEVFDDVISIANQLPFNNFLLKVKLYSILEKIMK